MLWLLSGGLLKHGWNKDSDARLTAGEFSHYLEQILDIGSPSRQAYGGWKEALLLLLILDCGGNVLECSGPDGRYTTVPSKQRRSQQ